MAVVGACTALAALAVLGLAATGAAANSGGGFFSFLEGLFGPPPGGPRRERWPERAPPAMRSQPPEAAVPMPPPEAVATYRTMCVRLCDGYYWPMSFAAARDIFERDAQACRKSCGATVALYYYPNPGGAVEEMVSLTGRPYKALSTAFLYRSVYDPACRCRPHPWEEASIERHKAYASQSRSRRQTRALAEGVRPRR
jgi:hypothetical protein